MTWVFIENPALGGMKPRILKPACHDQTPMIDVECSYCKATNHIHESQIEGAPDDAELAMRCSNCRLPSIGMVYEMRAGFAKMRKDGWYE